MEKSGNCVLNFCGNPGHDLPTSGNGRVIAQGFYFL